MEFDEDAHEGRKIRTGESRGGDLLDGSPNGSFSRYPQYGRGRMVDNTFQPLLHYRWGYIQDVLSPVPSGNDCILHGNGRVLVSAPFAMKHPAHSAF